MKIKFLAALGLAATLGLAGAGCRSASNTNTTNANGNTNATNATNANGSSTTSTTAKDSAAETAVKAAMDKAGYKDVTVEATSAEVTLRGTVPKGKLGDAVRIANETGKRKVNNQLSEK